MQIVLERLNDFKSNYKCRLQSLKILPLMMQLELYDILFFIRCLKETGENNAFFDPIICEFFKQQHPVYYTSKTETLLI